MQSLFPSEWLNICRGLCSVRHRNKGTPPVFTEN